VNPDSDPIAVLIALMVADNGNLFASQRPAARHGRVRRLHAAIARRYHCATAERPRGGVSERRPRRRGRIVQVGPSGGGCIAASLQIQAPAFNNVVGQTVLYAQMIRHHHPAEQNAMRYSQILENKSKFKFASLPCSGPTRSGGRKSRDWETDGD
jgi:hypothetical protein